MFDILSKIVQNLRQKGLRGTARTVDANNRLILFPPILRTIFHDNRIKNRIS